MLTFLGKLIGVTWLIFGLMFNSAIANALGDKVVKPGFYLNYQLGTLAWIPRARTRQQAKSKRIFRVLADDNCYELPRQGTYWFAINHRNEELVGKKGFVSVRILYDLTDVRDDLHLFRNKGWIDENDKPLPELDRSPEALSLNAKHFVTLHRTDGKQPDQIQKIREELKVKTGGLHARLPGDDLDSWKHAYLIGKSILSNQSEEIGRLSVRLIRFTVTAKRNSEYPLIFNMSDHGANGATIFIDAPGIIGTDQSVKKSIRFGNNKC
jgi:hypothetical protein